MNGIKRNSNRSKLINSDHIDKLVSGVTGRRDKALFQLMRDTGARSGEVVGMNTDSLEFESHELPDGTMRIGGTVKIYNPKSGKERTICLSTRAVAALTEYLKERGDDGLPALFVTKTGRITSAMILQMIHRTCDQIGVERIGPRQLRDQFAVAFIKGGGSPFVLPQLLGISPSGPFMRKHMSLNCLPVKTSPLSTGLELI